MTGASNKRTAVLAKIRGRLGVAEHDKTRELTVQSRLEQHQQGTLPRLGNLHGAARIARFEAQLNAKGVGLHHAASLQETATLIEQIAPSGCYATAAVVALGLDCQFSERAARSSVDACVSTCLCAIAETGTIVLSGDEKNPTTEVFLADVHIVLLAVADIEANMEAVWQRLRDTAMPRHLTMISGPSSTGDIEMQMEKGVHGPRDLQVILMEFE